MAESQSSRTIMVTGATGKQGGAVIVALLASQPTPPFKILAVTRSTSSESAKKLAEKPNVSLVEGDLDNCDALFERAGKVWGVYSVQPVGPKEEAQGKALATAAAKNNVSHFVYSSVDRGGPTKSNSDPTSVPHFQTKHRVEQLLKDQADSSPQHMSWTILRPVAFFDNFTNNFFGKVFAATWWTMGDRKLQFISVKDIGFFAALAFNDPEKYHKQALSLAGDDLNCAQAAEIFKSETGRTLPATFTFLGSLFKWLLGDLGIMFKWFEDVGYGAEIDELRKVDPELQDFRKWLRESSGFRGEVKGA